MKELTILKSTSFISRLVLICLAASLSPLVSGQVYNFDTASASGGSSNLVDIHASGWLDFDTPGKINLFIGNDSSGSWTDSYITGIFLLKPMTTGGTVTDISLDSFPAGTSFASPAGNSENFNGTGTGADESDYFSVGVDPNSPSNGIGLGDNGSFMFEIDSFGDNIDFDSYLVADTPQIFVRFRGIEPNGESAKAYAYLDPGTTAVPEPALIAPLGLAGIGCLLVVRRRLRAKAEAAKS